MSLGNRTKLQNLADTGLQTQHWQEMTHPVN